MDRKKLITRVQIILILLSCIVAFGNKYSYANESIEENQQFSSNAEYRTVSVEEYNENISTLKKISAGEFIAKSQAGETFTIFVASPDCYYSRQFSPIISELNALTNGNVYYYDIYGDDASEGRIVFGNQIGVRELPTTLYIKDGEVQNRWIRGGISAQELYTYFYDTEVAEEVVESVEKEVKLVEEEEPIVAEVTESLEPIITEVKEPAVLPLPETVASQKDDSIGKQVKESEKNTIDTKDTMSRNSLLPNTGDHRGVDMFIVGIIWLIIYGILLRIKIYKE